MFQISMAAAARQVNDSPAAKAGPAPIVLAARRC
jgi:hypothetical protein